MANDLPSGNGWEDNTDDFEVYGIQDTRAFTTTITVERQTPGKMTVSELAMRQRSDAERIHAWLRTAIPGYTYYQLYLLMEERHTDLFSE